MGNSSTKNKDKIPSVEVTCTNAHEYLVTRIKRHGTKVAQVDPSTGESVTYDAILERSAALAAGLTARGLRAGDAAVVIGENNVHYPWVLMGILQTGASAHLIDPRSTPREVEHAVGISRPRLALVSSAVSRLDGVVGVLRAASSIRGVLVWAEASASSPDNDLPCGVTTLEQMLVSPAKSASSAASSPCRDGRSPESGGSADVPVLAARDVAPGLAVSPGPAAPPNAPPPTPTSLAATYGDSCSSAGASPLEKILVHAVDGLPQPGQGGSAVVLILPSSGSTGLPKGVLITNDNLLAALELWPRFVCPDDVMAGLSPYFHAFGGLLMLMALCAGVTVVAIGKFSMEGLLDAVEKHQITAMHVVSSLLVSLGKLPAESLARLASVRRIFSGAAQISPLVQSALQARLPHVTLFHSYGMTETTFTTFVGEVRADKPGSPGTLVRSMECKVVDPDTGSVLPLGTRGEICFRGPMVMRGYLGNAEATSEVLDADGWLRSGDLGFADEDGYYYIIERLKDVLKYNGYQVSPSELEALLMTHPAVKEAAVVGEPHEYGEAPRALVILAEGQHATEEELKCFIAGKVAPHKQLRAGIKFVTSAFPRTASGKLQRRKLRALLQPMLDESSSSSSGSRTSTGDEASPVKSERTYTVLTETRSDATYVIQSPSQPMPSTPVQEESQGSGFKESSEPAPLQAEGSSLHGYRPSFTSLSTIYSDSETGSPAAHQTSLQRAAKVPLPPSTPTSPVDSVFEGSTGSAPTNFASPLSTASGMSDKNDSKNPFSPDSSQQES